MTARSKKQRMKNSRIKREKNKVKEVARLKRTVLGLGRLKKNAKDLLMETEDLVDEKTLNDLKEKQAEKLIEQEFIEEKREEIETDNKKIQKKKIGKKIVVTNENTGKVHEYNTRTLKDQFNSYPPWLNVGNFKRKIKRRKTAQIKNQFHQGVPMV